MTNVHFRAAMTLVEVLAVVVILGLLAGALIVGLGPKLGEARHEIAKTQMARIISALDAFQLKHQRFPTTAEGLAILTADPQSSFFIEASIARDPWQRTFIYLVPGPQNRPYEILTYGSDGQPGGTNEAADLSSTDLGK